MEEGWDWYGQETRLLMKSCSTKDGHGLITRPIHNQSASRPHTGRHLKTNEGFTHRYVRRLPLLHQTKPASSKAISIKPHGIISIICQRAAITTRSFLMRIWEKDSSVRKKKRERRASSSRRIVYGKTLILLYGLIIRNPDTSFFLYSRLKCE